MLITFVGVAASGKLVTHCFLIITICLCLNRLIDGCKVDRFLMESYQLIIVIKSEDVIIVFLVEKSPLRIISEVRLFLPWVVKVLKVQKTVMHGIRWAMGMGFYLDCFTVLSPYKAEELAGYRSVHMQICDIQ